MASVNKQQTTGKSARYRGIIISIIVFLLLILAILGVNLYSTFQINKNDNTVNTAAQMRDLTQSITRDLFSMQLTYGQDPHSPYASATLSRLEQNAKAFTTDLQALDAGGKTISYENKAIDINRITLPAERKLLRTVAQHWQGFSEKIRNYLPTATDIAADSTELDIAILQAEESSLVMYSKLNKLVDSIHARAEKQANMLRIIQIVGIVLVIIYFVIFMFYFIRKLRAADKVADTARRETDKILATVNEGLFLVDKDLNVGLQYSQRLESLIGQKKIANRNLTKLLSSIVSMNDLETSKKFIDQLFNKKVKEKLVQDLNPLDEVRASILQENGSFINRYLKFNFSRVYGDNDDIDAILVSIADNTRAVELEKRLDKEKKYNQQQVDMLASILHTDTSSMANFIDNTERRLRTINDVLRQSKLEPADLKNKINLIYREVHSLKGESSALGLDKFVQLAHESEEELQSLKNMLKISGNDFLPLAMSIEHLMGSFDTIKDVNAMLVKRSAGEKISDDNKQLSISSDTQTYQQHFEKMVHDIATREQKIVHFEGSSIQTDLLSGTRGNMIKDIAIQLIRNSIVHGIEPRNARIAAGKPQGGVVKMNLIRKDKDHGLLVITDDGAGIKFDKIRQKIVDNGTYSQEAAKKLDEKALLREMFKPGFSTAASTTEDAGRGVGLDIVWNTVKSLNGKIKIASSPGESTRFLIIYPL
ncbi:MAG: hypothetical protein CSA42_00160 [Gammaproteobacteria bacterium]|nr:MAG: hypothetical protein CSA42_00160 [Gammaproteobacteria bacterium]